MIYPENPKHTITRIAVWYARNHHYEHVPDEGSLAARYSEKGSWVQILDLPGKRGDDVPYLREVIPLEDVHLVRLIYSIGGFTDLSTRGAENF